MKRLLGVVVLTVLMTGQAPIPGPRLYVFDCGTLTPNREGVERYHVTTAEVGETRMPVPCFLIAHPRGTLMWDVGVIPDAIVEAQPQGAKANVNPTVAAVVTPDAQEPARAGRLLSRESDLRGHLPRPHRSHREPQRVCWIDVANAASRARLHVDEGQSARQPHVLHGAREQQDRLPRKGRARRLRRRHRDHQGRTGPHAGPSGPRPAPRIHRTHHAERRPVSLSAGAHVQPRAARQRVQRRAVRGLAAPHRGVSEGDEDGALDRARLQRDREAEEAPAFYD